MQVMTRTKRLMLTSAFLALIATNVLTLTNAAFSAAVSGLMSTALGVQTISDVLRSKVDAQKKITKSRKLATRRFGTKVTARTKKLVATTLAEIPGQAIPLLGIPILLAATAYEIKLACESLDDLDQLYTDMGMADETPVDVMHSVCDPELPDAGKVWDGVVDKSGEWWDGLVGAV